MDHLHYEQDGPVVLITIDRPGRMNAIGPQTHAELVEAWTRFRDDDEALVAALTGAGDRAFSAGGDLKASFLEGEPTVSLLRCWSVRACCGPSPSLRRLRRPAPDGQAASRPDLLAARP